MKKYFLFTAFALFTSIGIKAQTVCDGCPPFTDLDAECLRKCYNPNNNFTNLGNSTTYQTGTRRNSHSIIPISAQFEDPNAFYVTSGITMHLTVPPSTWDNEPVESVVRLGEASSPSSISYYGAGNVYSFVPTAESNLLSVYFAFVVQLPHTAYTDNPLFQIRVLDANNNPVPGMKYLLNTGYDRNTGTYYPNPDQNPLAQWYKCDVGYDAVIWVNWTPVAFDLRNYVGQEMKLEILVSGCTLGAHWGYAYYTAKCMAGNLDVKSCEGDSLRVNAPSGFEKYRWYDENGNEIGPRDLEQFITERDTNITFIKCKMTSYTGIEFDLQTTINYYELQADFDYREVHEDCQSKVYVDNTSKVRVIGTHGGYRPVEFVEWDFGDGSSDPNEIYQVSPVHTYQNPGNYTVRLILYDPDQECTDTVFQNITIREVERPVGYDTVSTCAEKLPYQYDAQHSLPNAGTYTITYTAANGCDSITYVTLIIEEPTVRIVSLLDYCDEFFTELEAITEVDNPVFLWNTGDILNKITVSEPGDYSVTVTDVNGCNGENKLNVPACIPNMILPNAISPSDENGVNDYFSIPQVNLVKSLEFSVYDRYGRQVFHTTDKHFKWYGDVDGRLIPNTTYTYILIIQDYAKTPPSRITGNITVL